MDTNGEFIDRYIRFLEANTTYHFIYINKSNYMKLIKYRVNKNIISNEEYLKKLLKIKTNLEKELFVSSSGEIL